MTNLELMNVLSDYPPDMSIKLDAIFNASAAAPLRVVQETDGCICLRDYYVQHNGDLVIKIADAEYVAVIR